MLLQITIAFTFMGIVVPDETHTVPLENIWALRMPGTKDIRKLDPPKKPNAVTSISKINEILTMQSSQKKKAGPCFLVHGEGKQALINAMRVLEGKDPIPKNLPAGKPLSVFFYSQFAPGYVHLNSAVLSDSGLKLGYEIVVHQTREATIHFALISVGSLSEGKFHVEINEIKPSITTSRQDHTDRAVCDPCTFIIRKEKVP